MKKKFSFPALSAGPPSRRNWYQELLDDPGCCGDPVRHNTLTIHITLNQTGTSVRSIRNAQRNLLRKANPRLYLYIFNPVTADQALIKHLARQQRLAEGSNADDDTNTQDINCCVIWARPPPSILFLIHSLQTRLLALLGPDLHTIPSQDLHLSVVELSHCHSVAHLRSVVDEISPSRIQEILDKPSRLDLAARPSLVSLQLNIDNMGIALSFVPSSEHNYTYHHLRADMHSLALESGVSIDMCYTAPSAHVTIGRFVDNGFFEAEEQRSEFVGLVDRINKELNAERAEWMGGEEEGLELQLGYLKFGRETGRAEMVGVC
jgi:hypothetical protein